MDVCVLSFLGFHYFFCCIEMFDQSVPTSYMLFYDIHFNGACNILVIGTNSINSFLLRETATIPQTVCISALRSTLFSLYLTLKFSYKWLHFATSPLWIVVESAYPARVP